MVSRFVKKVKNLWKVTNFILANALFKHILIFFSAFLILQFFPILFRLFAKWIKCITYYI